MKRPRSPRGAAADLTKIRVTGLAGEGAEYEMPRSAKVMDLKCAMKPRTVGTERKKRGLKVVLVRI